MIRHGFQPTLDQETTNQLLEQYTQDPDKFQPEQQTLLREHAEHYKIKSPDTQLAENGFGSIMSQAGKGWFAGFTTLNIDHGNADAQPRTSWERIARSLGHLGGFIGYIPGLSILSKVGKASKLATNLMKIRGHSIPLMAGKAATAGIKKTAVALSKKGINKKGEAVNAVSKFMDTVPGDMVEGALNLGIASGVSSWQDGIHAVADSMIGGGVAGAGFRAIGNLIKVPGAKPVLPGTKLKDLTKAQVNEKVLKGIAGSLMMGLPATLRGATTEEQIYDYLLGAFFGQGEQYIKNRRAIEHLYKMKAKYKDPESGVIGTAHPELVEGWEHMDSQTKELIREITTQDAEQGGVISYLLARDNLDKLKAMQEAETKAKEIYEGEPIERVRKPEEELTVSRDGKGADGETSPELVDPQADTYEALFLKTKHYVQKYLEQEWIEAPDKQVAMEDHWRIVNRKWNEVVNGNLQAESLENPAEEMIGWLSKKYKRNIAQGDAEWNFWIRWGKARKVNKPVQVGSIALDIKPANERMRRSQDPEFIDQAPDVKIDILNPALEHDAVNQAGNAKQLREPVKIIEEVFLNEYEKRHGLRPDPRTEPIYAVIDNIVNNKKSSGAYFEEQSFTDWKRRLVEEVTADAELRDTRDGMWEHLETKKAKREAKEDWIEQETERQYNNVMAMAVKQMSEKGYLYLGGKGDAERMYFVREHPFLNQKMQFEGGRHKQGAILKKFKEDLKKLDPDANELYEREKELFVKSFAENSSMSAQMRKGALSPTEAKRLFDATYLNNIMYDLSMNGLPISLEGFRKLNGKGMIKDAKAYNKRSQIWFTNGTPATREYVQKFLREEHGINIPDEGFKFALFKDTVGKVHSKSLAEEYVHTMDGEIITLPEIVDALNAEQGLPYGKKSGNVNKSFIVSNGVEEQIDMATGAITEVAHGGMLGKYQFKGADAEMAADMRARGIHMLIPESAAKQSGSRFIWDKWEWHNGKLRFRSSQRPPTEGEKGHYRLPFSDIKVVASEVTSDKYIKRQRLPKQMQSSLTPFAYKSIEQRVIDEIFERASVESFNGDIEINKLADQLLGKADPRLEDTIISNIEDLGIPRLLSLMNNPANESFTTKAYNKILRINEDIVSELQAEGEVSSEQAHELKLDAMEWQSVFDRIVRLKPDSLIPVLHKVGDSYRASVMRNYILAQIVKPRMKNSAASRMTGYDAYMQKKFPEMNGPDGDKIFYLDEGFRDLEIHLDDGKKVKLGQLWEDYSVGKRISPATKRRYKNIFSAIAIRVPMDSLSGAHKLEFRGFTGRTGFGSMLHPRTMEALGGADLDGDKASIFFGGEKHGFREEWQDAYHAQKKEYWETDDGQTLTGLTKIISGAQTGADLGGLEAGILAKITTGGVMPIGFQDERGTQPEYEKKYGVTEYVSQTSDGRAIDYAPLSKIDSLVASSKGKAVSGMRKSTPKGKEWRNPKHFGNPFSHLPKSRGIVKTKDLKETLDRYQKWLEGKGDKDIAQEQRKWILEQIDSGKLDNKRFIYMKKTSQPTDNHITRLVDFMSNRRDRRPPMGGHDTIEVPKDFVRTEFMRLYRSMTKSNKDRAIKGDKKQQVRWLDSEIHEFYDEVSRKKLNYEQLIDEALDVLRAVNKFGDNDAVIKKFKKHSKNIAKAFLSKEGTSEDFSHFFEKHASKIIGRVGVKEFEKQREGVEWSYDNIVKFIESELPKPSKKKPKKKAVDESIPILDRLPEDLSGPERIYIQSKLDSGEWKMDAQKLYLPRTFLNVNRSDGTVLFYKGRLKGGTKATVSLAKELGKPFIENPSAAELNAWLNSNNIKTLNVAGSRESKSQGLQKEVTNTIVDALKEKQGSGESIITDNKPDDMRELLTSQDTELLSRIKSPTLRWSPLIRYEASKGAYIGRNMLGPSVVNRSSILSAYNQVRSVLEHQGEETWKEYSKGMFPKLLWKLTPKTREEDLKQFRKVARATVAFASDPMDEAGLKGTDKFFNAIFDSLFDARKVIKTKKHSFELDNDAMTTKDRKKMFVGIMSGINSASFGKNLETGRAHSAYDFKSTMDNAVNKLPMIEGGDKGNKFDLSFNSKIAELTSGLDFSDSLLHRLDEFKLDKWYGDLKETLDSESYQELKSVLGRQSMSVPQNRPLEIVIKHKLMNSDRRKDFLWVSEDPDRPDFGYLLRKYSDYFVDIYKKQHPNQGIFKELPQLGDDIQKTVRKLSKEEGKTPDAWLKENFGSETRIGEHRRYKVNGRVQWTLNGKAHNKITNADVIAMAGGGNALTIGQRKAMIDNIVRLAGDSISNDMGDFASAKLINDIWDRGARSPKEVAELAEFADFIQKAKSKLTKERDALEPLQDLNLDDATKERILEIDRGIESETTTREMDQREIDGLIAERKNNMSRHDRDLLDALLISSWRRGNPELVKRLEKAEKKILSSKKSYGYKSWTAFQRYLKAKRKQLHTTQFNRVGFASKEVSDHIIRRQLDLMEEAYETFRFSDVERDPTVAEKIVKNLDAENKKQPLFNDKGERTQGLAIQASDYSHKTQKYLDEYAPFANLEKHKDIMVSSKSKKIMNEIISNMDYYGPKTREDLHLIVRDMINKDINEMTLEDWEIVNNTFRDYREGSWFQKVFAKVTDKFPKLQKKYYRMFPEAIDRDIMRHEIKWNDTEALYKDNYGNWITGKAKSAQGWMGEIQNHIHLSQELSTMETQREEREWNELTEPYMNTELGQSLWDYAVRKFEADFIPKNLRENNPHDTVSEEYAKTYERRVADAAKAVDWEKNADRLLDVTGSGRKSARQIVKEIQEMLALKNEENHLRLTGTGDEALLPFVEKAKDKPGISDFQEQKKIETYIGRDAEGEIYETDIPVISRKKMVDFFLDHLKHGKPFPVKEFGVDGLRKIVLGMQMGQIREAERRAGDSKPVREILDGGVSGALGAKSSHMTMKTGVLGDRKAINGMPAIYGYFPHVAKMFEKGILTGDLTKKIKIIWEGNRPREEKEKMVAKLYLRSKQLAGDFVESDTINESWEAISDAVISHIAKKKPDDSISWFNKLDRVGNQFSRENHVDGWDTSPEAYLDYTQSITKTLYKQIGQILSRESINEFAKQHPDMPTDLKTGWMNFFKLYAQQSLGFPAIIPEDMFDNPNMKIKGTLYGALADNRVAYRFDQIGRKLGLVGKGKELPPELASLDKVSAQTVINIGNAEAKYALATLLAHPKSSIGNFLGGTQMTIVNSGLNNFINAKSIDYLRKTIDPEFKSWEDVNKWVRELGIIEEFIIREVGANPRLTGLKWNAFLRDFKQALNKDPDLPDISMKDLMKKHKLSKGMMDVAGKFMSIPERMLRRDSFIAHYIQARDKLGGRTLPKDHPYLIEMGKRGVKATQFLYSVPFRPMFSGTAMGKVISRFQLWAWNSVRYRNTINNEAAIRGVKPGSMEYDRFKRLMIADTLSLSLGTMFMYSLFGSQMPQPYAWFQDLSDWLFGNEKDRDRAFFGSYPTALAPLQLITPPSARLTGPILNGLVNGDWEKMSNYYIWTMFPFGRLARDLFGPGGLTENPYYGVDKLTGIPVVGAKRLSTKRKRAEEKGTEFWQPPGLKVSNYFTTSET